MKIKLNAKSQRFKPYFSIEKSLNKIYTIKGAKSYNKKSGKSVVLGFSTFPQILIGRKIKLILVK